MNPDDATPVDDRELPAPLAEQFGVALGVAEPPTTLGEWTDETTRLMDDVGISVGLEEMCTSETSRHEVHLGDEVRHLHCVLDTLLVPFFLDEPTTVDVRSRSPVSGTVIEIQVSRDDIAVHPTGAVMSFGVAADVGPPEDLEVEPALAHERFCPYVNAFADEAEYEEWDAATPDAVTMPLSLVDGHALARSIARRPPVVHGDAE